MPRQHEYAEGTSQMREKDAERTRRWKKRGDAIEYQLIRGPVGFVLQAVSLIVFGASFYFIQLDAQNERFAEREAALLDIETTCIERGGSFAFSSVSDDVGYCYEKGEKVLFEVTGLAGVPEAFAISGQQLEKNSNLAEIK